MELTRISKTAINNNFKKVQEHPLFVSSSKNQQTNIIYLKLFDIVHKSFEHVGNNLTYRRNMEQIKGKPLKPITFSLNAFPKVIETYINKNMNTMVTYDVLFSDYPNKHITIFFFTEGNVSSNQLTKFDICVDIMCVWLYIVLQYAPKTCVNDLKVYLYMTALLKELPTKKNVALDERHVNTAFTKTCPVNGEIVIFRKEEWFKVFIHETFHNFGLDFSLMDSDLNTCDTFIKQIFKVNSNVTLFEAYTEFWARTINVLFCVLLPNRNKLTKREFLENMNKYMFAETWFSVSQMNKILKYYHKDFSYTDLFTNDSTSLLVRRSYKEGSNVLAYYILTSVLMVNHNAFLSWSQSHNSLICFHKTKRNLLDFCKFIKHVYARSEMIDFVSLVESKTVMNTNTNRTLRMTICELM